MRQYAPTSVLDERVAIRPSSIQGRGLFAQAPIWAGETVIHLGGYVIDDEELARRQPHSSLAIGEDRNLVQSSDDLARFGNHSCDPNIWMQDEVTVVARRDIVVGEELTTDYAMSTVSSWRMSCNCGASICRGEITGDDWKRADLQRRYGNHFSPFIVRRIAELRS